MAINRAFWGKEELDEKAFIDQIACNENIVFSIAAAKENKIFFDMKYGSYMPLGMEGKKDISADTRFNVGSVTKTVTSALIVKLAEERKLSLDDPVQKYLPEYGFGDVKIINLLTHTAGYSGQVVGWPENPSEIRRYFKRIYGCEKKHEAGIYREYASFAYSLVMEIIQRVSDMDVQNYAHITLFSKLDMDKTTYCPKSVKAEDIAFPYDCKSDKYDYELNEYPPTGDTGLYTTSEDLLKFGSLFLSGGKSNRNQVFSQNSIELMKKEIGGFSQTPTFWYKGHKDETMCFPDMCSSSALAHPGYTGCIIFIGPETKISYAILTNSKNFHEDFANYKRVGNLIISRMPG